MIEFLLILILIAVLFGADAVIGLIRFIVSAAISLLSLAIVAVVVAAIYVGVYANG